MKVYDSPPPQTAPTALKAWKVACAHAILFDATPVKMFYSGMGRCWLFEALRDGDTNCTLRGEVKDGGVIKSEWDVDRIAWEYL